MKTIITSSERVEFLTIEQANYKIGGMRLVAFHKQPVKKGALEDFAKFTGKHLC